MNIRQFYELVDAQKAPEPELLPKLKFLVDKYPYFQAGIFAYLKCLYASNNVAFNPELFRLAMFISDRKALFYYILNDEYSRFFVKKGKKEELTKDRTSILMDAFFESIGDTTNEGELESAITNSSMAALDYFSFLESFEQTDKETKFTKQITGSEVYTNIKETENLIEKTEIEQIQKNETSENNYDKSTVKEKEPGEVTPLMKYQSIIDTFISKAEDENTDLKIVLEKGEDEYSEDELDNADADEQMDDDDIFFTETLANIYIKQRKYEKAYEIIKRLSLNYPKKNIYFADQLSFLEKLINNTKSKR